MSFLSDFFKGNFSNLGTDITHAPASLASHPTELLETAGAAALPFAAFAAPEILAGAGSLFGGADAATGAGASALGFGADVGADVAAPEAALGLQAPAATGGGAQDAITSLPASSGDSTLPGGSTVMDIGGAGSTGTAPSIGTQGT